MPLNAKVIINQKTTTSLGEYEILNKNRGSKFETTIRILEGKI